MNWENMQMNQKYENIHIKLLKNTLHWQFKHIKFDTNQQIGNQSCSEPWKQMSTMYNPISVQLKIKPNGHEVSTAIKAEAVHNL